MTMKKIVLALVLSLGFAAPALANDCPNLIGQVEEAMKTSTVDTATMAKITVLLETGKAAHDAGDHTASVKALDEALVLLKV